MVFSSALCLLGVQNLDQIEIRLGDWDISKKISPQEAYNHFSVSVSDAVFYPGKIAIGWIE
jgi:hypothetical protein